MNKLDLESLWYEREQQALLREYEVIHGSIEGRIVPHDLPLPKLSDVLRCALLARAEQQIWATAQKEALMTEEELQFEDRGGALLFLLSPFISWFQLKNGLFDHNDTAFNRIGLTLRAWARGDFDDGEVEALRHFLDIYPAEIYIDDLDNCASPKGDKA